MKLDRLNAQIDRLIEQEIAAARKKQADKAVAVKEQPASSAKAAPVEAYNKVDAGDRKLSAVFERNKGVLPVPHHGPVSYRGNTTAVAMCPACAHCRTRQQRQSTSKGRRERRHAPSFDGEVSAVFQYKYKRHDQCAGASWQLHIGLLQLVIDHREARTEGQETRESLGRVADDGSGNIIILHFPASQGDGQRAISECLD